MKCPDIEDTCGEKNCNPIWNEEMTVAIKDPNVPIRLVKLENITLEIFLTYY